MLSVSPPGIDFAMSKFLFGTASLFNAGSARQRRRLLDAAVDHGFTHFDTAPLYGFGMAERDLAPVLSAHPNVTVTTKVGLYSPGGADQPAASILMRKAAGRLINRVSRPIKCFNLTSAQRSLDASLRRLGREQIELYLLHEPEFDRLDHYGWLNWLTSRVAAGQIGQFGLASETKFLKPFLNAASPLSCIVQTMDSIDRREADILSAHDRERQITYGYLSAALARSDEHSTEEILRRAMTQNRDGAVVVSTTKIGRIRQYADLAQAMA